MKKINIICSVIGLIVLFIIIHYIFKKYSRKEGMYEPETLDKFIVLQSFNNPDTYFDLKQLSKQANEQDLQYYNTNGYWFWDDATKKAYEEDLQHNDLQQEYPKGQYMRDAQNTYNQNIMKQILSWRAPEGQFLMNGVTTGNRDYEQNKNMISGRGTFPYTSGQLPKGDAQIVCKDNKLSLKKMIGSYVPIYAPLDYTLLPTLVPGFKFSKTECDPCVALKDTPDYSCPFTLDGKEPSYIWKILWGV